MINERETAVLRLNLGRKSEHKKHKMFKDKPLQLKIDSLYSNAHLVEQFLASLNQ